jgi:PAS domain-containing protein
LPRELQQAEQDSTSSIDGLQGFLQLLSHAREEVAEMLGKGASVETMKWFASERVDSLNPRKLNHGSFFVPQTAQLRTKAFAERDTLNRIMRRSMDEFSRVFGISKEAGTSAVQDFEDLEDFAFAVSAPRARDCPIVYVSKAFTALTGYSLEFSVGRSCRFLQPDSRIVNDIVNGEERTRLYEFCTQQRPGSNIVNLLLNETYDGKRFWNLLRMSCIEL